MQCFCYIYIKYILYLLLRTGVLLWIFFLYPFNIVYSDNISLSLCYSFPFRYLPIKWTLWTEFLGRPQILFVASGIDLNGDPVFLSFCLITFPNSESYLLLNLAENNWFRGFRTLKRFNLRSSFFSSITVNKNSTSN